MKDIIRIELTQGQIAELKPLFDAAEAHHKVDPDNLGGVFCQPSKNGEMVCGYLEPHVAKKIAKILKEYYTKLYFG